MEFINIRSQSATGSLPEIETHPRRRCCCRRQSLITPIAQLGAETKRCGVVACGLRWIVFQFARML